MSKYYSLKVSQAKDVKYKSFVHKAPSLYVEIKFGKLIQRTNTIKDNITPVWDETLPLVCDTTSAPVSVKLKRKSAIRSEKIIGVGQVELSKLIKDGKTQLHLSVEDRLGSEFTATVILDLKASDPKANTELALENLKRDIYLLASRTGEIISNADDLATKGNDMIGKSKDLSKALKDVMPTIDRVVDAIDNIADAHPYLKLVWRTASVLYRIVSAQVKADKRLKELVELIMKLFEFIEGVERLHIILPSFRDTIFEIWNVIMECCLLMRKHVSCIFIARVWNQKEKEEIDEFEKSLNGLNSELKEQLKLNMAKITTNEVLFKSLDLSPNEEKNAYDRPCCLPGTRTSIQRQIIEWASSDTASNIFLLKGAAGSGKSTIAMSIAGHFEKQSQLGAHLFFTRDKSKPGRVIYDLACSLASTVPFFAAHLPSKFDSSASADSPFRQLIQNPLTRSDNEIHDPIVIILDALDECGTPSSRRSIIQLLQNDFTKLAPKIRFLITSRPELDILNALSSVKPNELDLHLTDSRDDVHTYLCHALPRAIINQVPKDWIWDNIIKTLSGTAEGLFQWASTLIKMAAENTFPFRYLEDLALDPTLLSLQDLYGVALKNAFKWDEATKSTFSMVIALILFGKTQLSDETIDGILGLAPNAGSANILSKLRSLIAYESGKPIRLHHASFYDYLTSDSRIFNADHPWFFDINHQKQLIAGRCFDIMTTLLRFNICDLETSSERNADVTSLGKRVEKKVPPYLGYACRFWIQHLRDAQFSVDLLRRLTTFAYEYLLYWRKALSLVGNLYHQDDQELSELQDAIEWIEDGKLEVELSRFLSAFFLRNRFHFSHQREDIDESIRIFRIVLDLQPKDHPNRHSLFYHLASSLGDRFNLCHLREDLANSIRFHRAALTLRPEGHHNRSDSLYSLAISLRKLFDQSHRQEDLDEGFSHGCAALNLRLEDCTDQSSTLSNIAGAYKIQFRQGGQREDLDEYIAFNRTALALRPDGNQDRSSPLSNLAGALMTRFEQGGPREDLDECITLNQEALALRPEGHPGRHHSLENLAYSLRYRFHKSHQHKDLNDSIRLYHEVLALCPVGHPYRDSSLYYLASSLRDRFHLDHQKEDLDESITLHREALALCPDGHPKRYSSLYYLASSFSDRYRLNYQQEDLDDSIRLYREVLALCPVGHPYRDSSLYYLASSFSDRYRLNYQQEDLDDSIKLHHDALALRPVGHPDRDSSLYYLASSLRDRFHLSHQYKDLKDSIRLYHEVLALCPVGHPYRDSSLYYLASSLRDRFHLSYQHENLDESITLHREALALCPDGHPKRYSFLYYLASSFSDRYRLNYPQDLDDSIRLYREVLALCPVGHPYHDSSLYYLASSLRDRFHLDHQKEDLDESVSLQRAALDLRPEGHPHRDLSLGNLAISLVDRFNQSHQHEDLEESFKLGRVALDLRPEGHPYRSKTLNNLAISFMSRFKQTGRLDDLEECIELRISAALDPLSDIIDRLEGSVSWSIDARTYDHPSALKAYETALLLLQRTLTLSPTLQIPHDLLIGERCYYLLPLDAASYAIEKGDIKKAVEMLEQGRSLLWSQIRGFRTPLNKLAEVNKQLVDKFRAVNNHLKALSMSNEAKQAGSSIDRNLAPTRQNHGAFDEMLVRKRKLSEEQEAIIEEIRAVHGFEDFLKAPSFATLQRAADEGPVIIVNHCECRSDCIIMLQNSDPICIPLAETFYKEAQVRATHLIYSLYSVLDWLWESVVSLVIKKLKELGFPRHSRIWWCPTSILTLLPFHAACTIHGNTARFLIDEFVCSYTATLQALLDSRMGIEGCIQPPSLLVIGQPGKERPLANVSKEVDVIRRYATNVSSTMYLEGGQTAKESVVENLQNKSWVHFACHGHLKPGQPFDSSFELHNDERLTLQNIIELKLPNAELAFLSASHSAAQNNCCAHKVLHLAAGMQLCGFRSVIGTMWGMDDEDGPFVVEHFYKRMFPKEGVERIGYKGSARALQKTLLLLRTKKVPLERWVNFIHIGA